MKSLKRVCSLLLACLIVLTYAKIPAFATTVSEGIASSSSSGTSSGEPIKSNLVITGYKVQTTTGKAIYRISKGTEVNIEIKLKNANIKTSQIGDVGNIDVTKLVDSFEGEGTPIVAITSKESDPLAMTIKLSNIKYTGSGKALKIMIGYKNIEVEYDTQELTVTECGSQEADNGNNPAPVFLVSRDDNTQMIKPNQEAEITICIKNMSNTDAYDAVISLTPSDSIYLVDGRSTYFLKELLAKKSDTIKVKVKATSDISSVTQTIVVDLKYNYDGGSSTMQGSTSDKISISAASTGSDQLVPYIIVSNYTYGGAPVAANSNFKLSMVFANTSSTTNIENIVASMETGENFAIATSSNTFYYKSLGAGQTLIKELELRALPGAKPGAQTVEINFKYEYKDGSKRSSGAMSEKLSIPIYLPDRFELAQPKLPKTVPAGQEVVLTIGYVNKGKAALSNVEAVIEGEVESPSKTQNIGNIEAGKSGNMGFVFTPSTAGDLSFLIKISYEDANSKLITREFPIKLSVTEEIPPMDNAGEGEMEHMDKKAPWPIIILVVTLILGAFAGLIYLKKKKTKSTETDANLDFDWDDEEQINEDANEIKAQETEV